MKQSISTFLHLFTLPEFQFGIFLGSLGLLVLGARSRFAKGPQGWGAALACLSIYGIRAEIGWQPELIYGVALMGIGGWLKPNGIPALEVGPLLRFVAAWLTIVAGARNISQFADGFANHRFVPAAMLAAIAIGWSLSKWTSGPHRTALGPLFAVTAFGIWATVPETYIIRIFLGVALAMGLATVAPIASRTTSAGGFALGGTVAWLTLAGGEQRPGSVVGAWACIGVIGLVPLASRLQGERHIGLPQLAAVHVVAVLIAARVIGLWERAMFAAIGSVVLATVLLGVMLAISRDSSPSE